MPKRVAKPVKKSLDHPFIFIEERDNSFEFRSDSAIREDAWLIAAYLHGRYGNELPDSFKSYFNSYFNEAKESFKKLKEDF